MVYVLWNQLVGFIAKHRENPLENVKDGIVNASQLAKIDQIVQAKIPNPRFGLKPACISIFISVNHVIYQHFIPIFLSQNVPNSVIWQIVLSFLSHFVYKCSAVCLQKVLSLYFIVGNVKVVPHFKNLENKFSLMTASITDKKVFLRSSSSSHFSYFISSSWFTLSNVIYNMHCNFHYTL